MNSNSSENKYQAGRKPTPCNPEETCSSQGSGRMERGKGGESFGLWGRIKKWVNNHIHRKSIPNGIPYIVLSDNTNKTQSQKQLELALTKSSDCGGPFGGSQGLPDEYFYPPHEDIDHKNHQKKYQSNPSPLM